METPEPEVTTLLVQLRQADGDGRRTAEEKLLQLVWQPLHELAEKYFRQEHRANPLLQPTLLANDVFLKLVRAKQVQPQNRVEFFMQAARGIRQGLVDHARKRKARDGKVPHVSLDGLEMGEAGSTPDMEALDEALTKLTALDARQGQIVEMRFFCGCTLEEIGAALDVSVPTVKKQWRHARIWLHQQLSKD